MSPITDSPIKEAIRQQYYSMAANKEVQITNQLNNDCLSVQNAASDRICTIKYKNKPSWFICLGLAIVIGIFCNGLIIGTGLIIGVLISIGIYLVWIDIINQINHNLDASIIRIQDKADRKVQKLRDNAVLQIKAAYDEADWKTQQDIEQYDSEVKRNCQAILKKSNEFAAMINHTVDMFQRMVSHADSSSNKKFVEADFTYKVELYGICYKYKSTYSNIKDDFNFDKQRYRNLETKEECEGLAQAIAKMVISKMKTLYPPNSLNITVNHIDAEVTLHFKAANKNFIPPRDIF